MLFFFLGNPILCDAALPEIIAALEINKTKLIGSQHCDPPPTETYTKTNPLLPREDISIKPISESPELARKSAMFNVYQLSKGDSSEQQQPPTNMNHFASQHPQISNPFLQQEAKLTKLQTEMEQLKLKVEQLTALNGLKNESSVMDSVTAAKP